LIGSALSPMMIYGSVGVICGLPMCGFLKFTPSISFDPVLDPEGVRGRKLVRSVKDLLFTMFSFSACIPSIFGGVE